MDTKEEHAEPPPTTGNASSQEGAPNEPEGECHLETVEITLSAERHKQLDTRATNKMLYNLHRDIGGGGIESKRQAADLPPTIVSQSEHYLELDIAYGSFTECKNLIEEYPRVMTELQEAWVKEEYSRIRSLKILQLDRPRDCNPRLPKSRRWLTLSLVRHAESTGNVNHDVHQSDDEPLTQEGEAQAEDLGKRWANVRIDRVYPSPFPRAYETAQAIARHNFTAPVVFKDDDLKEQYLGTEVLQVSPRNTDAVYRILYGKSRWDRTPVSRTYRPGGGGESYEDVARRAQWFLNEILCTHAIPLDNDPQQLTWEEKGERERLVIHEKLDERIPHIVVVSHGIFLLEFYEAIFFYNDEESRRDTGHHWQNTSFARLHIGRDPYDEEPIKTVIIEKPPMAW